jgi:pyruvate/2-oxoacid:ferredoxin oxidoreductase alpha subunit
MVPSDPRDVFTLIQHTLNHADRFQVPVIFLVDKELSESYISYDEDFPTVAIDRGKLIT